MKGAGTMRLDGYFAAELSIDEEFKIPISIKCVQLLSRFLGSCKSDFNG